MPTNMPASQKGAAAHSEGVGVIAHTKLRESYPCPACQEDPYGECDYCDTGRVTLRRAEIIERQLQSQKSPKIG